MALQRATTMIRSTSLPGTGRHRSKGGYAAAITVLALLSALPPGALANQVSVTITNNTGETAADLQIILKGGGTITAATGGYDDESTTGLGTGTIDLDFGTHRVNSGKSNKFTFNFAGYEGFKSASWTDLIGDPIPTPINIGTDITVAAGPPLPDGLIPTFAVFDNPSLTDTLSLTNYAFATDIPSFDLFSDDPSNLLFGPAQSLTIAPGGEVVTPLGDLTPGTYVVSQGSVQIGSELPYSYFTATQVAPEPGTILLFAAGCLGLLSCRRKQRGGRRDSR